MDTRDTIYPAVDQLRKEIKGIVKVNMPISPKGTPAKAAPPMSITMEEHSMAPASDIKSPDTAGQNFRHERQLAKLVISCIGFDPTEGVQFFSLRDSVAQAVGMSDDVGGERMGNLLHKNANNLKKNSLDRILRAIDFPEAYRKNK